MVLQHRAEEVGERHKLSRFADSVIGRLYLAGAFGGDDELAEHRHNVLRDYADYHGRLYGSASAQSTMRDLTGMPRRRPPEGDFDPLAGLYVKFKAWHAALALLRPSPGCRLLTQHVTERATVYDRPPTSPAELLTLIRAADRLLELRGQLETPAGTRRKRHPPSERRDRRRPDLLAIYNREVFGPDDEELAAALAKFRLLPPSGSAD